MLTNRIQQLFSSGTDNDDFYEMLEDNLVEADIPPLVVTEISQELRKKRPKTVEDLYAFIHQELVNMIHSSEISPSPEEPECWLFLGVNGVGKTTSLAKLAAYWKNRGIDVILAAGDTFRAAAVAQMEAHAGRLNIPCIRQKQGADPAAVIFDALEHLKARGSGLVMADSAGRMHTRSQLMQELQKIDRIIRSKIADEQYRKLLVIDASTGHNAVQQTEVFHNTLGIDGIILSKYDSGARGGITLNIAGRMNIPFMFLGTGENYNDIHPFNAETVIDRIMEPLKQPSSD